MIRAAVISAVAACSLSVVVGVVASTPASADPVTAAGGYVSVAPARVLDTRTGNGTSTGTPARVNANMPRSDCKSPAAAACRPVVVRSPRSR